MEQIFVMTSCSSLVLAWFIAHALPPLTDSTADPPTQLRAYKPGNITLGALLTVHGKEGENECGKLLVSGIGYAEAIIFAVEKINNDSNLLPNVTLGYDIWDYCNDPGLAMKRSFEFVKNNYMNSIQLYKNLCRNPSRELTNVSSGASARDTGSPQTVGYNRPPVQIPVVIGPADSGTSVLVGELLRVGDIPVISPFSTSEELSSPLYKTFFRTIPPDTFQAKAMADIVEYFNWSYIAAVAVDHSYGRFGIKALEREANNRSTFCVAFAAYYPRSGYDSKMKNVINRIKAMKTVKTVVLWSGFNDAMALFEEAIRQGLKGLVWILSDGFTAVGSELLAKSTFPLSHTFLGIQLRGHKVKNFESYLSKFVPPIKPKTYNPWWKELRQMHSNCSKLQACHDILNGMESVYTSYVIDSVYAVAHALNSMYRCKGNNSVLSHGQCPTTASQASPEDLTTYLRHVSFQGISGHMRFDVNGDPTTSSYDIINIQKLDYLDASYYKAIVGAWDGTSSPSLSLEEKNIRWNSSDDVSRIPRSICRNICPAGTWQTKTDECCWACVECPNGSVSLFLGSPKCDKCPKDKQPNARKTACVSTIVLNVKWESPIAAICILMTTTGLCGTLFTIGVFVKYQNTALVKASNRELSYILLVTLSASYVSSFLYLARPTDILCKYIIFAHHLSHTFFIANFLIRTVRIVRAFQVNVIPEWFKKYFFSSKYQIMVVFLIASSGIAILISWFILDIPYLYIEKRTGRASIEVLYICRPYYFSFGLVLNFTIITYHAFLAMVCSYYAFKSRNLPCSFNEAKYIAFSLYIILLSKTMYYPIFSLLEKWYVPIIGCATNLITCYGILVCMFGSRLRVVLFAPEQNSTVQVKSQLRNANRVVPVITSAPIS